MRNFITILILLICGTLCQTCKVPINLATKNSRKELLNTKGDNYDLVVNLNLSTGCPKSMWLLSNDSLWFTNCFTPHVIKFLIDKSSSRVEFVNMKIQKDMKWDIYYYPKKKHELQTNKDTLLKILEKKIRFSVIKDSITSKVYSIKITDPNQLKRHIDNKSISETSLPKNRLEIYSCSLSYIFKDLENNLKIFIDYNLNDTNRYTMVVPRDNINNLIAYFKNECGIDFVENETKVEISRVTFQDLK